MEVQSFNSKQFFIGCLFGFVLEQIKESGIFTDRFSYSPLGTWSDRETTACSVNESFFFFFFINEGPGEKRV